MLALVLTFSLIVGAAPSASAADLTDKAGWINLLDYITVFDNSNFAPISGSRYVGIMLPYETNLFAIDMVVSLGGDTLRSVQAVWHNSGEYSELSIYSLNNGLYRIMGDMPSGNYNSFDLRFYSNGTSYITVQSLRVCTVASAITPETGYIYADGAIQNEMTTPGKAIYYKGYAELGATGYGVEGVRFNSRYWYKYDCVEFTFQTICYDINNVIATVGDYNCPVKLTYFLNDNDTGNRMGNYYVIASVDLSGVPRDLAYDLSLMVTCNVTSTQCDCYLYNVYGITYIETPSPLQYWFRNLFNNLSTWFSNVINSVNTGFSNLANWLSSGFQSVVDKLDVLVTGGSAGDKVSSGGNKIEQSSGSLSDNMDQIQDFENQQFGNLDAGMGTVIAGGDVSYLVAPLGFIHTYTNKIVAAIPSSYLVVFTLPMLFGVFMFIIGHPIKAPRPDTSGDEVTRETFTTTTVLEGKNKGSTTTTRTVSTSQEIGRRHNE